MALHFLTPPVVARCHKIFFVALLLAWQFPAPAAQLEVMRLDSTVLKNNPLHDPTLRSIGIFLPSQATNGVPLPIMYYLPGYGGSSRDWINGSNSWLKFTQSCADHVTPVIIVVVDARTRWLGSQYLNSPAQGNYEDYVCDEIVSAVEAKYPAPTNGIRRIVAGHSSGGFGALRLGSARQKLFDAVMALSPDSDFPVSHMPLVKIAAVSNALISEIEEMVAGTRPPTKDDDLIYALALSAAYAPRGPGEPGKFDWLYDADHRFRDDIWQRWLDNDPLTIVQKNAHAYAPSQALYLEGAAHDDYSANIGARAIYEIVRHRPGRCTFYEPPGHHADHVPERIKRGLEWIFNQPLDDIR